MDVSQYSAFGQCAIVFNYDTLLFYFFNNYRPKSFDNNFNIINIRMLVVSVQGTNNVKKANIREVGRLEVRE